MKISKWLVKKMIPYWWGTAGVNIAAPSTVHLAVLPACLAVRLAALLAHPLFVHPSQSSLHFLSICPVDHMPHCFTVYMHRSHFNVHCIEPTSAARCTLAITHTNCILCAEWTYSTHQLLATVCTIHIRRTG